jgi:hypothetical protein
LTLFVTDPAGFGQSCSYGAVPITSSTTEPGLYVNPLQGDEVPIQLSSSSALSGGSFKIVLKAHRWWHIPTTYFYSGGSSVTFYDYKWQTDWYRLDVDIAKLTATIDAAVDARKMHGQPNADGALPGLDKLDGNAPARPINFGPWIYKGGLFAGNMPWTSGDQSSAARTQLVFNSGGSGDLIFGTLAMLYMGTPAGVTGSIDLGAFLPSSGDTNISATETSMTWDHQVGHRSEGHARHSSRLHARPHL